jgi:hypothetical protein
VLKSFRGYMLGYENTRTFTQSILWTVVVLFPKVKKKKWIIRCSGVASFRSLFGEKHAKNDRMDKSVSIWYAVHLVAMR